MKEGFEATIVEDFHDGCFLADIDKENDTYAEEISLDQIEKILTKTDSF